MSAADHPRTRRALLGAGAAAAAVAAIDAMAPATAAATSGAMIYGTTNDAGADYTVLQSSAAVPVGTLRVTNAAELGLAFTAVSTASAVTASSSALGWAAIYGANPIGFGVLGDAGPDIEPSEQTAGVWGRHRGAGTNLVGVYGTSSSRTGVFGYAAAGEPPAPTSVPAMTGVYGYAPTGQGVRGVTASGIGVRGFASSGVAASFETATGLALVTRGRVRFQQIAGKSSIVAGANSVTVTPGVDLTGASSVLATLNGNPGAGVYVHRVAINSASNQFTIFLTANSASTISVAWFVLET